MSKDSEKNTGEKNLEVTVDSRRFSYNFIGEIKRPPWLSNLLQAAASIQDATDRNKAEEAIKYGRYAELRAIFKAHGLSHADIPPVS